MHRRNGIDAADSLVMRHLMVRFGKCRGIVSTNLDIKVWNISVGAEAEVNKNFVSPEGALLDSLQCEYDIVVNDGGLVAAGAYGTSVAAPWIARKLAYLIQIMRLPREVAKALIIDSARGWNLPSDIKKMGYGIVLKSIKDVAGCSDREIRFFVYGTTLVCETYTISLPIPATSKGHPFLARATMVYFPWCERNHGVDYTNTEMALKFGRIKSGENPEDDMIVSLNGDKQGQSACASNSERKAREIYRKWDNVKRVADRFTPHAKYREAYNARHNWGICVTTKERGTQRDGIGLPFGIVITLYEIKGRGSVR